MLMHKPFTVLSAIMAASGAFAQSASSGLTMAAVLQAIPQCAVSKLCQQSLGPVEIAVPQKYESNGVTQIQLPCVLAGVQSAKCSMADVGLLAGCMCTNMTLQSNLSTCVQKSCHFTDQVRKYINVNRVMALS